MPFPINDDFQIECPDCGGHEFLLRFNEYRSIVSCQNCPYVETHNTKYTETVKNSDLEKTSEYQLPEGLYF